MLLPMVANAYDAQINGIYYNFDHEMNTAAVTSYRFGSSSNRYGYSGTVIIPATVNYNEKNYDVTRIEELAFCYCNSLTSITIPNSVTSIGYGAFGSCSSLKSVVIPNSVTSIEYHTFSGCTSLTSIAIPNSVKTIGVEAFLNCSGLNTVTIPNCVTSIGYQAFKGCSSLTSVTIPNSLINLGGFAFNDTGWYNNQPDGILYLDNWLIGVKGEKPIGKLMIAEGTIGISGSAFSGCSALTSVTIPNSVMYISEGYSRNGSYYGVFSGCSGLTTIKIPEGITSIGHNCFLDCSSLTSVTIPNSVTVIEACAFKGCSSLASITIPTNVTAIGYEAFYECSSLSFVTIPNSLSFLGSYAFYRCSNLTAVTIPNSVETIEEYAFSYCSSLTSVTIPSSLTSIASGTFRNCSSLTSVVIPCSVTSIGIRAFEGCNQIKALYLSDLSAWCKFFDSNSTSPIIPSSYHLYLNNVEVEHLTIPNGITSLGNYAFSGCSYITSIIIPNSVMTIGESSFENCSELEELKLPENLQIIKKNAFKGCRTLKTIIIPSTVEFIYQETFANCDALQFVKTLPETPPFIYDNSFSNYSVPLKVPKGCKEAYQTAQGWKNFTNISDADKYKLTYVVDNEEYKSYEIEEGTTITPEPAPKKEGYSFSGWGEIPETMPAHDVTVNGTFSINKYKLTYLVDDAEFKTYEIEYGATITPEAEPTKEGYSFSGWSEIPETMPAHDVTVTGTFTINKYKLTYIVDGTEYKTYEIEYNATITAEAEPTKEGYTFSGWSEIPSTMPPYDVTVTGSFNINSYKLTYMIEDKVYKETMYEYGATITPEPQPEGDYATFEWTDLPQTMPAHDVVVYASYTSGILEVLMASQQNVRIYSPNGKKLNKLQKGLNIVILNDGTVKKIIMK